ncbi:unnamed protein product [Kluyveromyces dobzhanskii CBS 2104]|uniref:WGS project CCBQ000000000 data, contig 00058 n=1 Tax=Kluyveromyces dobzhanskii CBS 2104 TaxID=1427455 RepID=A0A0A8LBV7_9SACH|nr:unnamed protein product [Kluyveromyces dobzhanskii CBS 2104]
MAEMNEHSSFDGKGLRSMLIEKFHRKFSHAKGVDGTENGNMAQVEDYENARQEMKQGFESPSGTSMDPDVEMDMEMETNGFDITDSSSVDMIHDKPFSHYENAPTSKPKPFPKQLSLDTDASTWYVLEQQVSTPVMTPVNQSGPHQVYTKRHDSVSSLASSVSELGYANGRTSTANNLSSIPAPFTTQFVSLLLEVYLQVCSDPLVTPFDSSNPPSGILHRVSKLAVDAADADQVEIGLERNSWLLTLVRQRLLKEVRKESYMSRNSSVISLPPAPQFGNETSSTNMQQHSPQDYFSCNAMGAANSPPSSFPTNNYYAGLNSSFESRPSSQHQQLQQPLQLSQSSAQAAPQHPKSLARSRNNSFITAASRSRSNSFKVHPQLTNTLGSVQTPPLPNLTRSRSSSNAHFFLTPTNSIPSQSSYFSQSTASVNTLLNSNSSTINTAAAGQQLDERTARLPTHLENESHL